MVTYLSERWLERECELLACLPRQPDLTMRVQQVVTGGPGGDVTYHMAFESGRAVAATMGTDGDADLVVTTPHEVARAIAAGEVEAGVAFMQGRLKADGPTAFVVPLLALMQTPAYQAALAELDAETTS